MKKMVLVVVGCVVLIGAMVLISRPEKSGKPEGLERAQGEDGGAQASVTEGREASAAPENEWVGSGQSGENLQDAGDTVVASDGDVASTKETLSDAVKALLGLDGKKHNYPSLLKAINALDADMSVADVAALREMLGFPNDRFPEKMRPIEINAVKNDVLDKLLRQTDLPEGLGLQMVEMAGNAETDPVWRDYCIQFMTPFYERQAKEIGLTTKDTKYTKVSNHSVHNYSVKQTELTAVHDAMFSALDERDATLAGTALIGLELLSRTHDEFDRETIVGKATEIASDEMASAASRLTALRLSASGNLNTEMVDAARSLAQTGETVLLRSAAIVTLGGIGTPDDRELLESYALAENRQIAAAAKMALEKMDAQQDSPTEPDGTDTAGNKTISEPVSTKKVAPILINQDV